MTTTINGTTGIDKVAPGAVERGDLPAGTVLQVVQGSTTTQVISSSTTLVDTGLTATITPSSSANKILVIVNHGECYKNSSNAYNDLNMWLLRNGSQLVNFNKNLGYTGTANGNTLPAMLTYLDSPASTSAIIYKTQFANFDNNGAQVQVQNGGIISTITLMEIAA